ncbi:MAG: glycosyltransferase family 2 protein [Candidatus Omnitrophica bacterium]|nr:glycosyltransferase family 2 protein [Candidatus Omnitrophota bacterium]
MNLSAVLITRNEEDKIGSCLKNLSFCDEIIVVDSGSTDGTVAGAERHGARVVVKPFVDFASQKNFAVAQARGEWILSVDADEIVTPALREEIRGCLERPSAAAYSLVRRNFIFGKRLRFGGSGHDEPVRLFRKGRARFEGLVHETLRVDGAVGRLTAPLLHYSTADVRSFFRKLSLYAELEARSLVRGKAGMPLSSRGLWKPVGRFSQRYFIWGGFLDGAPGFIFAVLSGYYEFVREAIFWEMQEGFFDRINGNFQKRR